MSYLKLFQSIPAIPLNAKQFQTLEMALINPNLDAKACKTIIDKIQKIDNSIVDNLLLQLSAQPDTNLKDLTGFILNKIETLRSDYNLILTNEAVMHLINKSETFEAAISKTIQNPYILQHRVSKAVKGQEELVQLLSDHFYQWQLYWKGKLKSKPASIPLLIGSSGTGKTFTISRFTDILEAGIINIDASKLVTEGYVGSNISTELISQYNNLPPERKEKVVVFIDEVDKLSKHYVRDADVKGNNVLFELLTILEGDKVSGRMDYNRHSDNTSIDSSRFCYIFAGAFNGLDNKENITRKPIGFNLSPGCDEQKELSNCTILEDVIAYGMPHEVVGRIGWVIKLKPISAKIYKDILLCSSSSPLLYYQELYAIHGLDLQMDDQDINTIIATAVSKNLGVRGLRHALNEFFSEILPKVFECDSLKII